MRRPTLARCLTVAVVAATVLVGSSVTAGAAPDAASAPAGGSQTPSGSTADYIVTLDSDTAAAQVTSTARSQLGDVRPGARPGRVFRAALRGYTASLTTTQAAELQDAPGVLAVERDLRMVALGAERVGPYVQPTRGDLGLAPSAIARLPGDRASRPGAADVTSPSGSLATQPGATWGLDRIDQRTLPLSGSYTYGNTGQGVTAYVIDTGIRFAHADFGGRAVSGFDAVDGGSADDCNGHGTHVSSTVGGTTYGVAKQVSLVAVRVLDCNGSGATSGVIAGMDWVVANHPAGQPAVANMSLGGGASSAIDAAIARMTADGITVAVAAGNSTADACGASPARAPSALTIAASNQSDAMASFSNGGSCVDLIAPGQNITAAWSTGNTATNTISGTSMASPHAAGAAAKVLQGTPTASPAAVANALRSAATTGQITNTGQTCMFWIFFCRPATQNVFLFSN